MPEMSVSVAWANVNDMIRTEYPDTTRMSNAARGLLLQSIPNLNLTRIDLDTRGGDGHLPPMITITIDSPHDVDPSDVKRAVR